MFNIDVTLNLMVLFPIIAFAGIIGYALRSGQIKKKQMKVVNLRREVANNHAYILELQKECVDLENKLLSAKVAELPLKSIVKDINVKNNKIVGGFKASESARNKGNVNHSSLAKPTWNIQLKRKAN